MSVFIRQHIVSPSYCQFNHVKSVIHESTNYFQLTDNIAEFLIEFIRELSSDKYIDIVYDENMLDVEINNDGLSWNFDKKYERLLDLYHIITNHLTNDTEFHTSMFITLLPDLSDHCNNNITRNEFYETDSDLKINLTIMKEDS